MNFQRALEGELEHTVGSLADIESAQVHLVLPHDSLFHEQERPAKASVVIKLRHRSLADGEPDAIRNLVASAVDGLTPDHVVLVDAAGNLPLGPKTAEAMELGAEQALEQKVIATLEPVTGAGNVRAAVNLEYDAAATEETQENYDPDQTGDAFDAADGADCGRPASSGRHSRHCFQRPERSGIACLSATGGSAADGKIGIRNLRSFKNGTACVAKPGPGAQDDGGHRGERPAG